MERSQARDLLKQHVSSDWLLKHCLATAAVMEALAPRFGGDPEEWWTAGLLHDLDFNETQEPTVHGRRSVEILDGRLPQPILEAILAHNAEALGVQRRTSLDFALTAAETLTGLVVATALVMPDRRLASVAPASVLKRMKKKDFARKVSRERILLCEQAGLPLEELVETSVAAMQGIARELGL